MNLSVTDRLLWSIADLTVAEGTVKRSDDPVVKAHPNVFRPVEDAVD